MPLEMPEECMKPIKKRKRLCRRYCVPTVKRHRKILSTYLNLLTVYPDQPYDQSEVIHPIEGEVIIKPRTAAILPACSPKEETVLDITRRKIANGERVLIYTSWTRTDSQKSS